MPSNDTKLTNEQIFEIRRQARIELAKRYAAKGDILNWGKVLFPEKFNLQYCDELHGYFVDIRKNEFTNTESPRNHAKTIIKCFLIPLYQSIYEPKEFFHYLNVQATEAKSLAINTAIKLEIENNQNLFDLCGDLKGDRWTDQQFVLKNGVVFTAISAGQSIRGINYKNLRPDYIVVDDLYDDKDINNLDSTQKKNAWFWGSLYSARAKSKKCSIHVQGTAINDEDIMEVLKKHENVKSKTFKAVTDYKSKSVLWPELNSFESLERDREVMGSVIFFREMQNERRQENTAIVKRSWIRTYEAESMVFDKDYFIVETSINCDPSIGDGDESDYTGIALVHKTRYRDSTGYEYLIDNIWNEHLTLDGRIRLLQDIYERSRLSGRPVSKVRIEAIAGFKDFAAELRRRTGMPIKEVNKVPDKISNLENKSHYFENGKVLINAGITQKLKDQLIYQLTTNNPRHDDLRDSCLLALDDRNQPSVTLI